MRSRIWAFSLLTLGVVGLVIIGHSLGILTPFGDLTAKVLRPLQGSGWPFAQQIDSWLTQRDSEDSLRSENESLKEERDRLLQENSRLLSEVSDLEITREERAFLDDKGLRYVSSRVIGRSSDAILEQVIINVGRDDGVQVGFAVTAESGFLIGKVTDVSGSIAKVLLITDQRTEIAAEVQNETGAPGIVAGQLGLSLAMKLIPQNEVIQSDQRVITSGLESSIPKGLLIGTISEVSINPGDIFQEATVSTPIDFKNLGVVSVIIPEIANDA
ncbi:MAG: rod shape-determining protein MreC [bacterium]|nr:rod shape-determining protein MreC [bacterium]